MRKITPEDLVEYSYNEAAPKKAKAIKAALESDWSLRETFEQIVCTQKQLGQIEHSPREEAIKKIFDYADKCLGHLQSH